MPIKQAAKKALKQDKKRRARNLKVKKNLKVLFLNFRKAVEKKDKGKAKDLAKKLSRLEDVAGFGPREAHETTRGKSGTFGLGLTANDGGGVRLRLVASPRLSLGLGLAEAA